MAEKEDKGLIGFDPLAWMNDEVEDTKKPAETEAAVENKQQSEREDAFEEPRSEEAEVEAVESLAENEMDDSKITLAATLNIQNVTELYEQFTKKLDIQDTIEIDASAVVSIDTATLQLLIVLKKEAVKLDKEVVFDFPSDKFIEAAEFLGLAEMLEVDQAAAGFF